jgi:hypothetical protein
VSAVVTFENGKFVTVQKAKKEKEKSTKVGWLVCKQIKWIIIICQSMREMSSPDEMVYTITVDGSDVVCVQKFKRI